jgi:hypothetical protein
MATWGMDQRSPVRLRRELRAEAVAELPRPAPGQLPHHRTDRKGGNTGPTNTSRCARLGTARCSDGARRPLAGAPRLVRSASHSRPPVPEAPAYEALTASPRRRWQAPRCRAEPAAGRRPIEARSARGSRRRRLRARPSRVAGLGSLHRSPGEDRDRGKVSREPPGDGSRATLPALVALGVVLFSSVPSEWIFLPWPSASSSVPSADIRLPWPSAPASTDHPPGSSGFTPARSRRRS